MKKSNTIILILMSVLTAVAFQNCGGDMNAAEANQLNLDSEVEAEMILEDGSEFSVASANSGRFYLSYQTYWPFNRSDSRAIVVRDGNDMNHYDYRGKKVGKFMTEVRWPSLTSGSGGIFGHGVKSFERSNATYFVARYGFYTGHNGVKYASHVILLKYNHSRNSLNVQNRRAVSGVTWNDIVNSRLSGSTLTVGSNTLRNMSL